MERAYQPPPAFPTMPSDYINTLKTISERSPHPCLPQTVNATAPKNWLSVNGRQFHHHTTIGVLPILYTAACGTSWLVDPVDRYPLMFRAEFLYGSTQLVVCLVHVVVDNHLVKVLFVLALNAGTLVKRAAEVVLL